MDLGLLPAAERTRRNLDERHDWRYSQLILHGYDPTLALELALNPNVDLHQACDLLDHHCPHELARLILT